MSIKFRELATEITLAEKGKVEISVAQASEVLKIACRLLAKEKAHEVLAFIDKYGQPQSECR